jgi:hypothetical protein
VFVLQSLEILLVIEVLCFFTILVSTSKLLCASLYLSIISNLPIAIYPTCGLIFLDSDACLDDCSGLHTDLWELYSLALGHQLL